VGDLDETRYHWFQVDSAEDLSAVDLELSLDQVTWTTATHTTTPLLDDLPDPEDGLTRYWWTALFGPAVSGGLTLTETEQTVYGRDTVGAETLLPTWEIRSELPSDTFPCSWPVDYCSDNLPAPLDSMSADRVRRYERMAVDYLFDWTGERYGTCQVAVRPCRQSCPGIGRSFAAPGGLGQTPFMPFIAGGKWYNLTCGSCGDGGCGCGLTPTIVLPYPTVSVDEVLINGEVLDPALYQLQNDRYLVRLDGQLWPTCQDLTAPATDDGTWEITYTFGTPVPVGGQIAAGVLTVELAKAACRDKSCQLPQRFQSVTREGITVAALDAFDDIDKGHTGIWLIDAWVGQVTKSAVASRVYSPDVNRGRAPVRRVT
jgi:hypothetical protein